MSRVPEGESLASGLSRQLKDNIVSHGYDETISKSLRMEMHAVTERISSLKAGLRTWQDYLGRILRLDADHAEAVRSAEDVLERVRSVLAEAEKEKYRTAETKLAEVERMRDECQVRKSYDPTELFHNFIVS